MIPFNKAYLTGKELNNISNALDRTQLAGDGYYSEKCTRWLENYTGCEKAYLTHSCTAALEIAAILSDVTYGDEVIMPSYTFVSTANAFVLRGCTPVFVDIRVDTLNINEQLIEQAITFKTKAILVVHYAGVACEMDTIMDLARKYGLLVIEDAAQGILSYYKGKPLGSIGDFGCFSFHETKNIHSGQGGALIVNNPNFVGRASYIRNKGTNRNQFLKGHVSKYTWVDIGSSYAPGEIMAAFLWAQLQESTNITSKRLDLYKEYLSLMSKFVDREYFKIPNFVDKDLTHNGHIFYLIFTTHEQREKFMKHMRESGVHVVFHYIPLHSSLLGRKVSRVSGSLENTDNISNLIVRMPLWLGLDTENVIECVRQYYT